MKSIKALLSILFLGMAFVSKSQNTYLIPTDYSKDTIRACSGILVDGGGANGNYSSGDVGEVFIDPPGDGVVTFTFTSFSVGSAGSALYCRDESNNSWIAVYTNTNPPTLSTPIVTSAKVLYFRFYASFNSNPGFQLSWTTDSTTAPSAAFTASDTVIPFNTSVDFTNLSSSQDEMEWDFDDGITSSKFSPSHVFSAAGSHLVQLKASNCQGSDSTTKTIIVEERPVFDVSPDSVQLVASCGDSVTAGVTIYNLASSGRMITNISLLDTNESFHADFDLPGNLDGFVFNGSNAVTLQSSTQNYDGGSSLRISGKTGGYDPVQRTFPAQRPNKVSFAFRGGTYNQRGSFVYLRDDQDNSVFGFVAYDYATAYLTVGYRKNGYTQTNQNFIASPTGPAWVHVSYENIDWENETFDLYLNHSLYIADCEFYDQAQDIRSFEVYTNSTSAVCFIDEISFEGDAYSTQLSTDQAVVYGGDSTYVTFSFLANGSVGTQHYDMVFQLNDTVNATVVVPVEVLVEGTGILNSAEGSCPLSYGYAKRVHRDSLLMYNSGCDSLRFTSIQGSSGRLQNLVLPANVQPYDSMYVPFDFFSATSGQFSDTIFIATQDSTYAFCVALNVSDAPITELDTNAYYLYSTLCLDTVSDTMTIYNLGTQNLNWSITQSDTFYFDDFEGAGMDSTLWLNWGPGATDTLNCGTIAGSKSLTFKGAWGNNRTATTRPLNVIDGATVEFQMYQGNCGTAGGNMPMFLQYSLNGTNWTDFAQFHTWEWSTYPTFSAVLPIAGRSSHTQIRFIQKTYASSGNSWVVDNVKIMSNANRSVQTNPTSGSILPGDSQKVVLQVYTKGLASGMYNLGIEFINGDPDHPLMNLPVTLELDGPSSLAHSALSCSNFDTLLSNALVVDSILLWNEGCGWAQLDSAWSTDSLLTVYWADTALAPFDTTYLVVQYEAKQIKSIQDSIFISTTDSLLSLCYSGWVLEAPSLTLSEDSITAVSLDCQDTIDVQFYVGNDAPSATSLRWSLAPKNHLNVVMVNAQVFATLAGNIEDVLEENPLIQIKKVNSVQDVVAQLSWADVVIFPPVTTNAVSSNYQNIETDLQDFVAKGGTMVVMGSPNISKILSIDFMNATVGSNHSNQLLSVSNVPPYTNGVTSFTAQNAAYSLIFNHVKPPAQHIITKTANDHIYSIMNLEDGKLIYFGFTFAQVYDEIKLLLHNLMKEAYDRKSVDFSWLSLSPTQGFITGGDSTQVTGQIFSSSLRSGIKECVIEISTNDPLQSSTILPLQFNLQGKGELASGSGCIDLGEVPYNARTIATLSLENIGCADLLLQSMSSTDTSLSAWATLPGVRIAPADSSAFPLSLNHPSLGVHQDTITFYTNTDTLALCVSYESLGAAKLKFDPDTTLYASVNQCKGSINKVISLENIGLDTLNYHLQIGDRYDSTDTQEWNYNPSQYYQKVTHTFNNVISSDTLFYEMIINGEFSGSTSRFYIYVNGTSSAFFYDNDKPDYTNDTISGYFTGSVLQNALNQGFVKLDVYLFDGTFHTGQYCTMNVAQYNSCPWATFSGPNQGSIDTSGQNSRTITLDPSSLAVGTHKTTLFISSNDASKPLARLPIEFEVMSLPELALSNDSIYYGTITSIGGAQDSVLVVNTGCNTLQISNISSSNNEFIPGWTTKNIGVGNGEWLPITYTAQTPGNASGTLTLLSNDTTRIIYVNGTAQVAPTANFTYQITNSCKGKVSFANTSSAATSYLWDFGNGNSSSATDPNTTFDKPGTYVVMLIAQNVVGGDTVTMNVNLPDVLFTHGVYPDTAGLGPILFSDSSLVPISRQWSFGDGNTSTDSALFHTYNSPGTYFVTLGTENAAGCTETEVRMIYIKNDIGLVDLKPNSLIIYPAPTTGPIHIQTNAIVEFVEVYNARGEHVLRTPCSTQLDLSTLPAGSYWLRIRGTGWEEVRMVELIH